MESIAGDLVIKSNQRFALVVAEFNEFITARLAKSAVECLRRHGAKEGQVTQFSVPGCFDATIAMQLAKSGKFDAVICLGAVIRGQTDHYDHVAQAVARGVAAVGPATGVPTLFGVITADTVEQAIDRAGLKAGNTGWHAATSAIAMVNLMGQLPQNKVTKRE